MFKKQKTVFSNFIKTKGKCVQEGTFFANTFPSLGNFVNNKVGFQENKAYLVLNF